MVHRDHRQHERSWPLPAGTRRTLRDAQIVVWKGRVRTMSNEILIQKIDFDFARCADCGSINYWDDIIKGPDPTATDGTLPVCPDCHAVDDIDSLTIAIIHDATAKAYLSCFMDREGSKVSPFKMGMTEKDAREALLASHGLLL